MHRLYEIFQSYWQPPLAVILLIITVVYAWNNQYILTLDQGIREEMAKKENLLGEQKILIKDIVQKKSPKRIAAIAKEKPQMTYPKPEQIIPIKSLHVD